MGDLRLRIVDGKETANFWDVEKPKFAIDGGPAWLTIDREVRKLDDSRLGWGVEKVISTSTERVGSATRRFSIEVGR